MQASAAITVSSSPIASTRSSPVHPASLVDPSTHSPELMQLLDITRPPPHLQTNSPLSRASSPARSPMQTSRPPPSSSPSSTSRARAHLSIALAQWARERVFLGALIATSKYTQDSTLKNAHWALVSGVFGTGDIGRIEHEFLEVLDWREGDVLAHHAGLVAAAASSFTVKAAESRILKDDAHAPVPGLEPSSPQSSAGSLSPRTPHSLSPSRGIGAYAPTPTLTLAFALAPILALARSAPAPHREYGLFRAGALRPRAFRSALHGSLRVRFFDTGRARVDEAALCV
ncbi:hypothetical protein B0H13DRAFT_2351544 [Mycena leptocephala]|nr:hypothetical protein B0H13DRAFT_2351544 [Mycena leptocephala]